MEQTHNIKADSIINPINNQKENISNLTQLWKVMGHTTRKVGRHRQHNYSLYWPNRLWFDWDVQENNIDALLDFSFNANRQYSIPLWPNKQTDIPRTEKVILNAGYTLLMRQCAMRKSIQDYLENTGNDKVQLVLVTCSEQAALWANCISKSFGYLVDMNVIMKLVSLPSSHLYLIYSNNGSLLGVNLLFEAAGTIGLHYLGILPEYRNRKIAYYSVQKLLRICRDKKYHYLDLQSSPAGMNLYKRLGFESLFFYNNYILKNIPQ